MLQVNNEEGTIIYSESLNCPFSDAAPLNLTMIINSSKKKKEKNLPTSQCMSRNPCIRWPNNANISSNYARFSPSVVTTTTARFDRPSECLSQATKINDVTRFTLFTVKVFCKHILHNGFFAPISFQFRRSAFNKRNNRGACLPSYIGVLTLSAMIQTNASLVAHAFLSV